MIIVDKVLMTAGTLLAAGLIMVSIERQNLSSDSRTQGVMALIGGVIMLSWIAILACFIWKIWVS
jgi:hypothetical protein